MKNPLIANIIINYIPIMTGTIELSVFLAQHWSSKQYCLVGENDLDVLRGKLAVSVGYLCWPQGLWPSKDTASGRDEAMGWPGLRTTLVSYLPSSPLLWLQDSSPQGLPTTSALVLASPYLFPDKRMPYLALLQLQTCGIWIPFW